MNARGLEVMYPYESYCDCCGLVVDTTKTEICPRCQYPVKLEREQWFLEATLRDLKRVIHYGGASISVRDLVKRYEGRLQVLHYRRDRGPTPLLPPTLLSHVLTEQPQVQPVRRSEGTGHPMPPVSEAQSPTLTHVTKPFIPTSVTPIRETQITMPTSEAQARTSTPETQTTISASMAQPSVPTNIAQAGMPLAPAASMRGFSLSSDAVVNILAALGGFFILAGSLSFVLTTSNLWLSFVAVFCLHAVFGGAGQLIRRRFPLLQAVAPLYTLIFALLVPLVGFSAYRLVTGGLVALSPSALLALAASYAAAIYIVLAVTQRFVPFAYLGMVALVVGDLALAQTLHLAYWWWPSMALLLALLSLLLLPQASGDMWPLAETWAILRTPFQALMYAVVSIASVALLPMLVMSLVLDGYHVPSEEAHLALFVLAGLLFVWTALWIWCTRRIAWTPLLAYLFIGMLLLLGYAWRLDLTGYALLLTGTALAYHGLVRVASAQLASYGLLDLTLDQLAIGLSTLVMLLLASATPLQLIVRAYAGTSAASGLFLGFGNILSFPLLLGSTLGLEQLSLGLCCLLTFDITLRRAGRRSAPTSPRWCWLLLLSGFILAAAYAQEVLYWRVAPFPALLALSLFVLASAVLMRRYASPAWAYPLEALTLGGIAFTLVLSLGQTSAVISTLLLGYAALLSILLFFQHRPLPALVPMCLLLLAVSPLLAHPVVMLALGLLLPLGAACMQRAGLFGERASTNVFAWTLFGPALLYGLVLTSRDLSSGQSVFVIGLGWHLPMVYEVAALGVAWYATALITRTMVWLLPAAWFWFVALPLAVPDFWTLTVLVCLLVLGAVYIERCGQYGWALLLYGIALYGVGVVVYAGLTQGQVMALSWVLLLFALLAYSLGLFHGRLTALWLATLFATTAVIVTTVLLGDLYRSFVLASVCAILGLVVSRSSLLTLLFQRQQAPWLFALPLYATALVAALLTGLYGTLVNVNYPFYGAVPTMLFLYALVTFIVLLVERRPSGTWLVAGWACWAVLLVQHLTPTYMLVAGVGLVLLGWQSGRFFPLTTVAERAPSSHRTAHFTWSWPWYVAFLCASLVLGHWPYTVASAFTSDTVAPIMLTFALLATAVMLLERVPTFVIFPAGMAVWTIHLWLSASQPALTLVAYTLLCMLIFMTQFIWWRVPVALRWLPEVDIPNLLSLGGLCVVILSALNQHALAVNAGTLAHAGAFALVALSLLLFLYGFLYPSLIVHNMNTSQRTVSLETAHAVRHWCTYAAGLLLSLAVSWELRAFHVARFDVLTLAPASYLIVIAPFVLRDATLPARHVVGQLVALLGAALLLLPSLWLSLNGTDLLPAFLLLGEAFFLFILGLLVRLRIFILSSTALIIVGTLRILFLAIPPSVPILLMVFGSLLVLLATVLILARHRLQAVWQRWK